jgi:protein-tyrosine phosphatase
MAEGAFRHFALEKGIEVELDSAGTGDWHVGESPDHRMQATSKSHGVDISDLRARHFTSSDYDAFDRIYVMDESNYENVIKLARNDEDRSKVSMMLNEIYPGENKSVPDPYFGGQQGFEHVYELLTCSAEKVLSEL